jgi:hypothetical protein
MGLSIHYSGHIRDYADIDEMMVEVADICENLNWTYHLLEGNNSDHLKGICFSPEGCEPVFLTFLLNGRMCSAVNLMHKDIYEDNNLDSELLYTTSTKTQFAGPDAHIALIKLLRYLKGKYFAAFELNDEGMYWETMDEKVLHAQFARYDFLLNAVADALSNMEAMPGESAGSLADRIEKMLRDKFTGEK